MQALDLRPRTEGHLLDCIQKTSRLEYSMDLDPKAFHLFRFMPKNLLIILKMEVSWMLRLMFIAIFLYLRFL